MIPWQYGHRQPQPPDDLPDDFTEGQEQGDEDDEEGANGRLLRP